MGNLFKRGWNLGWYPDADSHNAPPGSLLRADNVTLDEAGALSLRHGSTKLSRLGRIDTEGAIIYTTDNVDTVRSFLLREQMRRFCQADDTLYLDGMSLGGAFDGIGDMAFGTDSYQAFVARGTTKRKHDGLTYHRWDIPPPELPPLLAPSNALYTELVSFSSTEATPSVTLTEGTRVYITGADAVANGGTELTVDALSGRASVYRKWTSDQNLLDIAGVTGGGSDLFDILIGLSAPERADTITIMFGLGTGTDPFRDDYYYFDFNIKDKDTVNLKDAISTSQSVYKQAAMQSQVALTPDEITRVKTPKEVIEILSRLGRFGPRSRERKDSVQSSPAWGHFAVTRSQFNRVGSTAGRSWSTVRAIKVVAQMEVGNAYKVNLDSAIFYGGGSRALTGKYQIGIRYARDFGEYVELSPFGPLSQEITLNQQGLNITIPPTVITNADPQVNRMWVYMYGGFLDTFYRVAVIGLSQVTGMTMDEFAPVPNAAIDAADRTRFNQIGFTIPSFTGDPTVTIAVQKAEWEAIRDGVIIEPGAVGPPDNIVAIEGPYNGRMFALTDEGYLYPSLQDSPSNFSVWHTIDLRKWGTPKWMKRGTGGIHVGMSADVIRIDGTGDESADRASVDLYATPLHLANPPVDACVYGDGHTLVYRAADGLVTLSGTSVSPVAQAGTGLLWRGKSRHGVEALDRIDGRFRLSIDNQMLYMLAPESTTNGANALWRFDGKGWSRFSYPFRMYSIDRAPDGRILVGGNNGEVWEIETQSQNDDGAAIPIEIVTPCDDADSPLQTKTALDLQISAETSGAQALIQFMANGSSIVEASEYFSGLSGSVYRSNIADVNDFVRLQSRITGSFSTFILRLLNVSYRIHPQQVMVVDTGYLVPPNGAEMAWISRVEVSVRSPSDLQVIPVFDDVEMDALDLPVLANKTSTYSVMLKRGQRNGRRPLIRVRSTAVAADGEIGAEIYWIRVHFSGSGNRSDHAVTVNMGSITSASAS